MQVVTFFCNVTIGHDQMMHPFEPTPLLIAFAHDG